MIIARWQGFEIDSSEGYYVFTKEMQHTDEGWRLLTHLLSSPLVWKTVGFDFQADEGREALVEGALAEWRKEKRIRAWKRDKFSPPVDTISASGFLGLFKEIRADLEVAWVRFALAPPKVLNRYEYRKLRKWFFLQFADEEAAKLRWAGYCRIKEKDISLSGHTDMTDSWTDAMGLEATLEVRLKKPFDYRVFVPAVDPTMIVYLLGSLLDQFHLIFRGDHYISINMTPDFLSIARLKPEDGTVEAVEVRPGPGASLTRIMEHHRKQKKP